MAAHASHHWHGPPTANMPSTHHTTVDNTCRLLMSKMTAPAAHSSEHQSAEAERPWGLSLPTACLWHMQHLSLVYCTHPRSHTQHHNLLSQLLRKVIIITPASCGQAKAIKLHPGHQHACRPLTFMNSTCLLLGSNQLTRDWGMHAACWPTLAAPHAVGAVTPVRAG